MMEEHGEEEQHEGRLGKGGVRSLCAKGMKLLFMESQREGTEKKVGQVRTDLGEGAKGGL